MSAVTSIGFMLVTSHSSVYAVDCGYASSALGTYIANLPAWAGFLCMYLAHLINLREGERERKKGEEKEEKEKEKKRRRREG